MQQANQPPKFFIAFAQNDSARATIPPTTASAVRASQSLGFPPLTGAPPEAGGVPPERADFNGILNQLAGPILWALAGGRFGYDSAFAADALIGGYPLGAVLPAADNLGDFISTVENNAANPNTNGAGWVPGYHYGTTVLTAVTGGTVALTQAQAAKRVIRVSGTLTSNLTLVVPAWQYDWTVYNNTGGAFTVSVRTATGSAAAIPQNNAATPVTCDGTNCALLAPNIGAGTSPTQAARRDQVGGRLLNIQTFTASGTYTPTAGTNRLKVTVVGGGGGGGASSTTGAAQASVGGSGGGGGYAIGWISVPSNPTAVTVGAGGAAGAAGIPAGQDGAASTFLAMTGNGGLGGTNGGAVTTPNASGGASGGSGTGGNVSNGAGSASAPGIHVSVGAVVAGLSGASLFGGSVSNAGTNAGSNGQNGTAPGAGGSGGVNTQSLPGRQGGAGAPGIVIIEEYA